MSDCKRVRSRRVCVAARMFLVLVFFAIAGFAAADTYPRQPGIEVQKYSFEVTLSDASDELSVNDTIDVRFTADGIRGSISTSVIWSPNRAPVDHLNPCLIPQPRSCARRGGTASRWQAVSGKE